jgi:amino acid adenylation domain-containing protein
MHEMQMKNVEDMYPLSPMQQGMLFHILYAPNQGFYHEQLVSTLHCDIQLDHCLRSWQRAVERHPVLRTAFVWKGLKEPVQVVHQQVTMDIAQRDWRGAARSEQDQRLAAYLSEDRRQGFDLSKAPLMRVALMRLDEDRWQLVWSYSHLLLDGWSVPLVLNDVFSFYESLCTGKEVSEKPSRPYREYIKWVRQQDFSKAEDFWRDSLRGIVAPTPLGVDRIPEEIPGDGKAHGDEQIRLSKLGSRDLRDFARQSQLTLNTVTQGAWALLLSHYSGERDVVFGATVSGRPAEVDGVESMVGVFINTLPVRITIQDDITIQAWLRQLQGQFVELRRHECTPLVQVQSWSESGGSLFESLLVFENYPTQGVMQERYTSLRMSGDQYLTQTNYPLTVFVIPGEEVVIRILYDCRRFERSVICRMLEHFKNLLAGMVADPASAPANVPILSESERRRIVVEWNATEKRYPGDMRLPSYIEQQVDRTPDAVALTFQDQVLSYRELNARANQLAHHLRSLGIGADTMVGICLQRSVEMVVGLLGIVKAGAAYVPLDPDYPRDRLEYMIRDAGVPVLLTQQHIVPSLPEHSAQTIALDSDWPAVGAHSRENPLGEIHPENLAYMIYTSGSTGKPKGAMNTHRGICNRLLWMQEAYRLTDRDRVLQKTPFSFDVSVWEFFWPLMTGAQLVVAQPGGHKDGGYLVKTIMERGITTIHFVPSMLAVFLREKGVEKCTSLRNVICSGEALTYELQELFFSRLPVALHNLYGPTEASVDVTSWACIRGDPRRVVPIGRPIANTQIYILNSRLQPIPTGVSGELHIGGVGLARGYHNRPELTAEKFIRDPFSKEGDARLYKTGDLSRFLPDGNVEYLGRMDNQIKIRGFRVELGEIESALRKHPAVLDTVVVAREDSPGEKRIVAYYVQRDGGTCQPRELRDLLVQSLPDYMIPAAFMKLPAIPLSANGKVERRALPKPDESSRASSDVKMAPRTSLEETIAKIWEDLLGIRNLSVLDNFFEIGGNSLLLVQVHGQLQEVVQREFPLVELFNHPTVLSVAEFLSSEPAESLAGIAAASEPASRQENSERMRRAFSQRRNRNR